MSIKQMAQVWDSTLPPDQRLVLLALADYAHDDGSRVYPTVATVAHKTGYSIRSVQRIYRLLEQAQVLVAVRHRRGGHRPTEYALNLDATTLNTHSNVTDLRVQDRHPRGVKMAPVEVPVCHPRDDNVAPQGRQDGTPGVTPLSPRTVIEPLIKPLVEPSSPRGRGPALAQFWCDETGQRALTPAQARELIGLEDEAISKGGLDILRRCMTSAATNATASRWPYFVAAARRELSGGAAARPSVERAPARRNGITEEERWASLAAVATVICGLDDDAEDALSPPQTAAG